MSTEHIPERQLPKELGGHAEIASWKGVMYTITGFKDFIVFYMQNIYIYIVYNVFDQNLRVYEPLYAFPHTDNVNAIL